MRVVCAWAEIFRHALFLKLIVEEPVTGRKSEGFLLLGPWGANIRLYEAFVKKFCAVM